MSNSGGWIDCPATSASSRLGIATAWSVALLYWVAAKDFKQNYHGVYGN